MTKSKWEQFFIIKAENIPEDVSIQAVEELIESATRDKQVFLQVERKEDPRGDINFNKPKPISWRTMQKVFNVKTRPRGE